MKRELKKLPIFAIMTTLVVSLFSQLSSPVNAAQPQDQLNYAEDELIVKYKPNADVSNLAGKHGGNLAKKNDKIRIAKIKVPKGSDLNNKMKDMQADPSIEYVEYNYKTNIESVPNDPSYSEQWGIPKIKADQAWDNMSGGSPVTIAIIDTGVKSDHPDLTANVVAGYNTISDSTNTEDDHGHGTHAAGIAAGKTGNGVGISGVSGNSQIMPIKAMGATGSGFTSDISEGVVWAVDHGAKVINMSLGTTSYSQVLQDAINYAYNQGAIVIAAAGNSNVSTNHYPAAMDHVVGVSATTTTDTKASFSNYGSYVDIAAPGTDILSTTFDGSYGYKQGTSMASPFVAGVAALVWSQRPTLTPGQLEQVLEASAKDIGTAGKDIYFGYGLVDALTALTQQVDTSSIGLTLLGDTPDPLSPTGSNTNKISFSLNESGAVTLKIYDSSNILVKTLLNNAQKTLGTNYALWNGKNESNVLVPSGVYTYKLDATDMAGNAANTLEGTITVDRTNPVISNFGVADPAFSSDGGLNFIYTLSEDSKVIVGVFNSSNQLIKSLVSNAAKSAGVNQFTWDGKNSSNVIVPDGGYTLKIDAYDQVNLKAVQQAFSLSVENHNPNIMAVSDSPDPFKVTGTTVNTIKYTLSENATVSIRIFDSSNSLVRSLLNGPVTAGAKTITWNGKNDAGLLVPDGSYTYKIDAVDGANKSATQITGTITTDKTAPVIGSISIGTNPFAPTGSSTTSISYSLSEKAKVTTTIYNSANAVVKTLQNGVLLEAGAQAVAWDGKNASGVLVGDGTYTVKITATDLVGFTAAPVMQTMIVEKSNPTVTAVSDSPDPFRPTGTNVNTIKYTLSENANVVLKIYDSSNQLVKTLVNGPVTAGAKSITWNGKNDAGAIVPTGTYTYTVDATDSFNKQALQVSGTIAVDITAPTISSITATPNPFTANGTNLLSTGYTLSESAKVTVSIYNSSNALVKTVITNALQAAGANTVTWNGKNSSSVLVSAGTYTYKITATDPVGNISTVYSGTFSLLR